MKHIISLSGGIGSYFTLKRVLEKQDKEDVMAALSAGAIAVSSTNHQVWKM